MFASHWCKKGNEMQKYRSLAEALIKERKRELGGCTDPVHAAELEAYTDGVLAVLAVLHKASKAAASQDPASCSNCVQCLKKPDGRIICLRDGRTTSETKSCDFFVRGEREKRTNPAKPRRSRSYNALWALAAILAILSALLLSGCQSGKMGLRIDATPSRIQDTSLHITYYGWQAGRSEGDDITPRLHAPPINR